MGNKKVAVRFNGTIPQQQARSRIWPAQKMLRKITSHGHASKEKKKIILVVSKH